jgi:ligand-binding sensor domain-containing protein/signal transduction histidine kinase
MCGIVLLSSIALLGQSPEVRFEHIGLARKQVNAVLRDGQGFLWIGTTEGLYRYDGHAFREFRQGFGEGRLSDNNVRALAEDAQGDLWIATHGAGLNQWQRSSGSFRQYRHDDNDPDSLVSDNLWTLLLDSSGHLWIGTQDGLDRFDPAAADPAFVHYRHHPEDPFGLSHPQVEALLEDPAGGLWIGTQGGLNHIDPNTGTLVHYRQDPARPQSLVDDRVRALAFGRHGGLWVGTLGGLDRLDPASGVFIHYHHDPARPQSLAHDEILTLLRDRLGTLWIGTRGGLSLFDSASESFITLHHSPGDPLSPAHDRIYSLHEDDSGLLWVGTRSGIDKWNPLTRNILHYRADFLQEGGLAHSRIRTIVEDDAKALWISTAAGISRLDRARGSWQTYLHDPKDPNSLSNNMVSRSLIDSDGNLWFSSIQGLNRYDPAIDGFVHPKSLRRDDVTALTETQDGKLWLGTWGRGLVRLDRQTASTVRYRHDAAEPTSLGDDVVVALYEASPGDLWLGYDTAGLGHFDRQSGRFKTYRFLPSDQNSPSSNRIVSMHGDDHGILWLGTRGGGLDRFDTATETFRHFTEDDGLASNSIFGILEGDEGQLWISTTAGISRFDPRKETFRNYGASDGFQGDEFNIFAYYKSPSGELFFGGWDGLSAFYPAQLEENRSPPSVVLTSYKILNEEVEIGRPLSGLDEIELGYDNSMVTFEMAALDFYAPHKNRYAYQLEGSDWVELGTKRDVTLTHLQPGEYTLDVRASNHHGFTSEEAWSLKILVTTPLWLTWWFKGVALLVTLLLTFLIYQRRTRRIRQRNRVLATEIVQRQQAERELEHKNQQLETKTHEIRERHRTLAMEIVQRKQVEVELEHKNLLLETKTDELEKKKSELENKTNELELFSYTISHDLRNPLFTLQGFVGILERDIEAEKHEAVRRDLDQIRTAADTIQRLLDQLLELWSFSHTTDELAVAALSEIVAEALQLCAPQIAKRGVDIDVDADLPSVLGDRQRLVETFKILIDNAVKFIGKTEEPRVHIGVRIDGEEVLIFIEDNGIGILRPYHEKVFGLFEQLDPSCEGTGLGLAIARRVVEMHGGRIWVKSRGIGKGSTFFMSLPVALNLKELLAQASS